MINGQRVLVVLPAYRAGRTLEMTYNAIPHDVVDDVLLVDDHSDDNTLEIARKLAIRHVVHDLNKGYGANQKTCYSEALRSPADIIIMLHPDYQYDPRLVTAMASMVSSGIYDFVLGSRILGGEALAGGMPLYKYLANRVLTEFQNLMMGTRLTEFHTGYRAYSRKLLETLSLKENSDDFVFDNQMLAQAIAHGFRLGEISCPTRYFAGASSIDIRNSIRYGIGVIATSLHFRLWRWGLAKPGLFAGAGTGRQT